MGHFLEILAQLLGFLPPYGTPAESKSEMGKIGNFFGGLACVVLVAVTLGVLAGHFLF
jgi:hypothetical protein